MSSRWTCAVALILAFLLPRRLAVAQTIETIAVLDVLVSDDVVQRFGLSEASLRLLSDSVRGGVQTVAGAQFTVLTRENVVQFLPAGVELAVCAGATCEVETGRLIGATFVVSSELSALDGQLVLNAKAYATATGALLSQRSFDGRSAEDLVDALRQGSSRWTSAWLDTPLPPGTSRSRDGECATLAQFECVTVANALPQVAEVRGHSGGPSRAPPGCSGFISDLPSHTFDLASPTAAADLTVARADGDTTLVVRTPGGGLLCNDDANGRNPQVARTEWPEGRYMVWVGSFDRRAYDYTLEFRVR